MKKKQSEEKKKSKLNFDIKENKTLIVEITGAIIVLGLIITLLCHACGMTKYTVTFESNGGTAVTSQKVIENNKVSKPNSPTKDGYAFSGWYYNDVEFDFNTKITANIKLEAKWEEIAPINPDAVSGISLEQTEVFLAPKGVFKLVADINPDTALDKKVSWSSSDTSIATVDQDGKVTAIKEGKVTITATTNDGGFEATALITVTNDNIPVTGVSLNKTVLDLSTSKTELLKATINPGGASNTGLTWSSSDTNVAVVDQNGKITAKKEGIATITVTTKDGNKTATCKVTVKDIAVAGVSLSKTTISLVEGTTASLTATIKPADATNKGLTWSSSNTNVATVDQNGKVTAKSIGTATITVTTKDGSKTAKCTVNVTEKIYKYTYKTTALADDAGFVNYYKLCIYQDGKDISSNVGAVYVPAKIAVREGSCFKIATVQYNNLPSSITADFDNNKINVTKG